MTGTKTDTREPQTGPQTDSLELRELQFALHHAILRDHTYADWCDGCNAAQRILTRIETD